MYQQTLRTLELHSVVFIGTPCLTSVEKLADICKDFFLSLMHLALSKIGPYAPDACHSYSDTRKEVASVYRWDNGEGGGVDGLDSYAWDLGRVVKGLKLG